jgi:phospholipase/carboxylesterase
MNLHSPIKRIVLLHGVGGSGAWMRPLVDQLGIAFEAHCPDGPHAFDMGVGRQWFSVKGVTEANRPARVADALPVFNGIIEAFGDPRETLLIGFSQGAIMALHAVAAGLPVAGVIALSGRLAEPVAARTGWPPITLLHGAADPVMPPEFAHATQAWLQSAGADAPLQMFDRLGHAIDDPVLAAIRINIRSLSLPTPIIG